MARYCSDCSNFNTGKKKVDGICQCNKTKKFVPGCMPACDKFSKSYSRGWYEKEKLYDDGKKAVNSSSGKDVDIMVPILLIILLIILKILHIA